MHKYHIYSRHKNKSMGLLLFKGEAIEAVDEKAAIKKACRKDFYLRQSRLMAVLVKDPIPTEDRQPKIQVDLPTSVESLTPEQMKEALSVR